jgi:hypothetical protein
VIKERAVVWPDDAMYEVTDATEMSALAKVESLGWIGSNMPDVTC